MDTRTILLERLAAVRDRMERACLRAGREPADVTLIAVTKSVTPDVAAIVAELGIAAMGESRPQELWKKAAALPSVNWHLIGHLQRNKIERTMPLVTLMHSVDSERVLDALSEFGQKQRKPVPVLLEVNCSREAAKGGFAPEALPALGDKLLSLPGISLCGLMTMAAYSNDPEDARPTFTELRQLRDDLRRRTGLELPHLSMGMSGDYEVGIEEGATFVRVGSTLFENLP